MSKPEMFFSPADYAVFDSKLASNPDIDGERERVHNKLVGLHKLLFPEIRKRKWDLHPHWMSQWLVSASRISPATARIEFMTLRYSKPEATIKLMKQQLFEDFGHFYANAMLDTRIDSESFSVELLVSEKAWVDAQNLQARLQNGNAAKNHFRTMLAELGADYSLILSQFVRQDGRPLGYQQVLRAKASRLVNTGVLMATMAKYRPGGHDLRFGIQYKRDDKRLRADTIVTEVLRRFEQLYPLYAFLSWSPENDFRKPKNENTKTPRRTR